MEIETIVKSDMKGMFCRGDVSKFGVCYVYGEYDYVRDRYDFHSKDLFNDTSRELNDKLNI